VLLRLACLGVANAFAMPRLLPTSDRDEDAEILALRHQLAVPHRQLGSDRVRFTPSDRALLAALLCRLHGGCSRACTWSCVRTLCCGGIAT
jgi:putative transposase